MHDWKIGDWLQISDRWLVFSVTPTMLSLVDSQGQIWITDINLLSHAKHLPDCTGWDWREQPPAPKYRPFKNGAEFEPHRERWITVNKGTSTFRYRVLSYSDAKFYTTSFSDDWVSALEYCKFADDGTPFGVRE